MLPRHSSACRCMRLRPPTAGASLPSPPPSERPPRPAPSAPTPPPTPSRCLSSTPTPSSQTAIATITTQCPGSAPHSSPPPVSSHHLISRWVGVNAALPAAVAAAACCRRARCRKNAHRCPFDSPSIPSHHHSARFRTASACTLPEDCTEPHRLVRVDTLVKYGDQPLERRCATPQLRFIVSIANAASRLTALFRSISGSISRSNSRRRQSRRFTALCGRRSAWAGSPRR